MKTRGMIGKKHSEETKRKIGLANSIALKGHIPWNKGLKLGKNLEHSLRMKGRKLSETTKEKMKKIALEKGFGKWMQGKRGNKGSFKKGNIAWNQGKHHPKVSGEKCHLWRGGITPINKAIRNSSGYKWWRLAVFARDNYICIWCGARSEKGKTVYLNADHIKPFSLFPELRFAIDNGRTLCRDCHKKTSTYGNVN